eukprot:PITA_12100
MASSGKIEIKKFNGLSFELWKLKMEDLLVDKDQWIMVDPSTKPTGVSNEEWKKLDWKAKSTIRLCVSDLVLMNVLGEATTKDLWEKLGTLYQSKSLVNKLFLRKKVYNLRMKGGDLVTEHVNTFITVSQNRNKNKSSSGRSKSRGRYKSPRKHVKVVCWKCGKKGHYKRDYKSKTPNKGKGSDDAPSQRKKPPHMKFTPHREWFCEYEKYDGRDVFLGDDRKARIVGRGKVKLKLQGGRVRTLPGVLHIPALARNLISVSKLDDAV